MAVGDIWFRIEDHRVGTGYIGVCGDYVSTGSEGRARLRKFWVIRETPKGVWLTPTGFGSMEKMPDHYRARTFAEWKASERAVRFQRHESGKRFACATMEEALVSFRARKYRQIGIYQTRIGLIEESIRMAEREEFRG